MLVDAAFLVGHEAVEAYLSMSTGRPDTDSATADEMPCVRNSDVPDGTFCCWERSTTNGVGAARGIVIKVALAGVGNGSVAFVDRVPFCIRGFCKVALVVVVLLDVTMGVVSKAELLCGVKFEKRNGNWCLTKSSTVYGDASTSSTCEVNPETVWPDPTKTGLVPW